MHTYAPTNSIFNGPLINLLSILRSLVEILSRAQAKRAKSCNDFKFGRFSNDGAAYMAVNGLRTQYVTE